jgi:hypothetical protein
MKNNYLLFVHYLKHVCCIIALLIVFVHALRAQGVDSAQSKPKPIGAILRTVREIDMTNDSMPEIMQIETTKAQKIRGVSVRFAIYSGKKALYQHFWKAEDFFDAKDRLSDTVKWLRLQRIMRVFFSDQNFLMSEGEDLDAMFKRVLAVDIKPGSEEFKEFAGSPHKIFAVYGGRDMFYGITWLASKKKFVTLWRN